MQAAGATKDGSLDKFGWGDRSEEEPKKKPEESPVETLSQKKSKQTCTKCDSEMAVLAIIINPNVDKPHSGL